MTRLGFFMVENRIGSIKQAACSVDFEMPPNYSNGGLS
jgi:hypothetical protein